MNQKRLYRLTSMLDDVNEKISKLDSITDFQEREAKAKMFEGFKNDIEKQIKETKKILKESSKKAVDKNFKEPIKPVIDEKLLKEEKLKKVEKPLEVKKNITTNNNKINYDNLKLEYTIVNDIVIPHYSDELMAIRYEDSPLKDFNENQELAYSQELLKKASEIATLFQNDTNKDLKINNKEIIIEPFKDPIIIKPYVDKETKKVSKAEVQKATKSKVTKVEPQVKVAKVEVKKEPMVEVKKEINSQPLEQKNKGEIKEMPKETKTKKEINNEEKVHEKRIKNEEKSVKEQVKEVRKEQKAELKSEDSSTRKDVEDFTRMPENTNYIKVELPEIKDSGVKALKQIQKRQKQLTSKYSKLILNGAVVTTTNYQPNLEKHVIELNEVTKSYLTGDVETQVLKGINIVLNKSDFIVILGPSGSGKTTFLNTISGLDKATKGDVFVLGYNLSLLKDSHLTKFRRKHVGFIFQQYNLLTNLTAKENAEVGENLSTQKHPDMTIEDIFETIGMKDQMNKYPHQMSGGQQQRVSIARALAKNPDILFADEPTGALDEEMGRKVLEILVSVNKRYKTTVIVVTHNPNIAKIGNTIIHIKNGLIDSLERNENPADPSTIDWS